MPDDPYWDDTLLWSEHQCALLRRLAAGERVNDVDWEHVIEEIEDVGKSELRACTSQLSRAIEHMLKIAGWPGHSAAEHWRAETLVFLRDARLAFSPSMRQKIDLGDIYDSAVNDIRDLTVDGCPPSALPPHCPFDLDELLARKSTIGALLAKLALPAA
jgi:hypothetical protein